MGEWPKTMVLVGAGKMGGAMLIGWLDSGLAPAGVTILEPSPSSDLVSLAARRGMTLNPPLVSLGKPDILVLAVKPQTFAAAATPIASLAHKDGLVLSIIAGKTTANLIQRLPQAGAVVRAMPNTPAAILRGATAAYANDAVTPPQRRWVETLLGAIGVFHWVEDEPLIDAVTAISGSGPAYVFALVEALAAAGERLGLPAPLAMSLARATVEGSGELLHREPETSAAVLRQNVTSPAGTTAAALAILQGADGLAPLMARATAAARDRAREMAG